jgi:hypothetical protein
MSKVLHAWPSPTPGQEVNREARQAAGRGSPQQIPCLKKQRKDCNKAYLQQRDIYSSIFLLTRDAATTTTTTITINVT